MFGDSYQYGLEHAHEIVSAINFRCTYKDNVFYETSFIDVFVWSADL